LGCTLAEWGAFNYAVPVTWSTWLAVGLGNEPEAGGGLMVAAIQLAIMLGGAVGGFLLDHVSIVATFIGGAVLLVLASLAVRTGHATASSATRRPSSPCPAAVRSWAP